MGLISHGSLVVYFFFQYKHCRSAFPCLWKACHTKSHHVTFQQHFGPTASSQDQTKHAYIWWRLNRCASCPDVAVAVYFQQTDSMLPKWGCPVSFVSGGQWPQSYQQGSEVRSSWNEFISHGRYGIISYRQLAPPFPLCRLFQRPVRV